MTASAQTGIAYAQHPIDSLLRDSIPDSLKLTYPITDHPFLNLHPLHKGIDLFAPKNIERTVEFDPISKQYIVREKLGNFLYRPPQYFSIDEFLRYDQAYGKRNYWRQLSDRAINETRQQGILPAIEVHSESFEKIFGGNTISIIPRGSADVTLMGQVSKNKNPLFNERQRKQLNFDFDQRIQMNVTGQIGDKLKLTTNYNTESQFDFENQIKLDYTGKDDDIIRKIEVGNVSMPINSTLISGTQALFGIKTQLQFGKLGVTSVFSQQRSQSKEITINNGAQQSEFSISADSYESNRHYFLAQYFRENFNRALSNAPVLMTNVNITQIEVWVTNRSNAYMDSRDVLALLDLGEYNPYNTTLVHPKNSPLPSSGIPGQNGALLSNDLSTLLGDQYRQTNSNAIQTLFQGSGANDNYAKLTYARKLRPDEFVLNTRLGFISLNVALNADQVLAVAYRYTANGREYQVGEFSTDRAINPSNPEMLYVKLLKNEILKTTLPTWDLMMKNIYSIGAYQVSPANFFLNIFRLDDESGVEQTVMAEGSRTANKLWIQLTGLDRLNPQNSRQPDGVFDFLDGVTIDAKNGRLMFPVLEPFGKDLASQFAPGEELLADKYIFQALYDSTVVLAQQLYANKNRYVIKGTYESEVGTEFQLGAINVPYGSVQVFAGNLPLQEGTDFTVDYDIGRVRILNESVLQSGQPVRIKMENNELFGLQQRTLFGTRLDYLASDKLQLGATYMNLSEKPLTQKVNIGQEPISNTMWGFDVNYNSTSRWLTRMVDKLPFINTKAESSISFYGEFAQLIPGSPKALNFAGSQNGVSYIDDFENSQSVIDLKGSLNWQISGTPQLFPESNNSDDLSYGFNRARLAFYNIDPIFYRNNNLTPDNIRSNVKELSNHYVREVLEQEVFPNKESITGQPLYMSTLDLGYYPMLRGPHNYTNTGITMDGKLTNPKDRWGGIFRKIETPDFESQNIGFIEVWMMDPFVYKKNADGGDLYFNLGNISEDILKDGRKSMENGLPANGDLSQIETTHWGRVIKNQPVVQAFDNDPAARARQDVGLDGLSDDDERSQFANFLNQMNGALGPEAAAALNLDPSGDDYSYYRGPDLDAQRAGILKRYERYNGTEGNSKTPEQSTQQLDIQTSAATLLPDAEDINRDNNMNEADEYYQYRLSIRPQDMQVGKNFIVDKITANVTLANKQKQDVNWYQFRIPITEFQDKVGDIQDFKSIRFVRMFLTHFADTTVLRMAKLQLVRGEWRGYNAEETIAKVLVDPAMTNQTPSLDASKIEVAAVNIEQNGNRTPIPYVVPPGIERQIDYGNSNTNVRLNEQALSLDVRNLSDGYGRAAYRTSTNDFRSYKRIQMFVHAEQHTDPALIGLKNYDLRAFLRIGIDGQDNYYEYSMPLKVTNQGAKDPEVVWPEDNRMNIRIELFQEIKEARNRAIATGQAAINKPYSMSDGENTITIKGQPDISKVRFYMLGVLNPLKQSARASEDDGQNKSAIIWFNELRLTDFDDKGGWAATARLNAKLADLADVTLSGSKSTIGFGSIDQRISERNRSDDKLIDLTTSVEFGKFFPESSGIRIPFYFNYSNQVSTPQYNPLMPDIELKNSLAGLNNRQKDSLLRITEDFTTRKSFNFTNVRKIRMNPDKPVHLWDIENWSLSYAYTQYYHRDYLTEMSLQKNYRASLAYDFSNTTEKYIEPFKKIFKNNSLTLLRDLNFNLMPSLINFRIEVDRLYNENTLRENSPANTIVGSQGLGTLYNKNFTMNRYYGVSWNLTRNLKLDFNATNYSVIDEPQGRLDGLKRDTLWENFWKLGRTTDYNHMLNLNYTVPLDKIPGLKWVNLVARYGAQFTWQAEPLVTQENPDINLGNSIQNSRTIQVNPTLNMTGLYSMLGLDNDEGGGGLGVLKNLLTSIKNVNAAFTRTEGTYLPGYTPKTNILGYDFDMNAPGLSFLLGGQSNIWRKAAANGWLTSDSLQTQLYSQNLLEDFSIRAIIEPFRDLSIELTANRIRNQSFTTTISYSSQIEQYENLTPNTSGDYSISFFSLGSAFKNGNSLYHKFETSREAISQRLGSKNINSGGITNGYADGYGPASQDVVVSAFLETYAGRKSSRPSNFPKIPIPNWFITYNGLNKLTYLEDVFANVTLTHKYNTSYNVNGYNSMLRYAEADGAPSARDVNDNFLPELQYTQITLFEQFIPLIGIDARFKNNMSARAEFRKSRTLSLSLQNSQLSQLNDQGFVLGFGYRFSGFQFPFGLFESIKLDNDLNLRLDASINDLKTIVYRPDAGASEVAAGNLNISYKPSVEYFINQRFNMRLFYDSNMVKPYTSQTFATSYTNFGINLRMMLQ
ncbi:cell surface protein SprA [bacterium A37T11]|nr:cell surface protein SprA [bacterium A37T11]